MDIVIKASYRCLLRDKSTLSFCNVPFLALAKPEFVEIKHKKRKQYNYGNNAIWQQITKEKG